MRVLLFTSIFMVQFILFSNAIRPFVNSKRNYNDVQLDSGSNQPSDRTLDDYENDYEGAGDSQAYDYADSQAPDEELENIEPFQKKHKKELSDTESNDYEPENDDNEELSKFKREAPHQSDGDLKQMNNLQSVTKDEIASALSKLNADELETLDKLIVEESSQQKKRDTRSNNRNFKYRTEDEYGDYPTEDEDRKSERTRCSGSAGHQRAHGLGCKIKYAREKREDPSEEVESCAGQTANENDGTANNTSTMSSTTAALAANLPSSTTAKPDTNSNCTSENGKKTKRHARRLSADQGVERRIHAKIDYLREKSKRKIMQERKAKTDKRESDLYNNFYYSNFLAPRIRRKRENLSDKPSEQEILEAPIDESKSPEHLKLLAESFPNPNALNSIQYDLPHVRVKRA